MWDNVPNGGGEGGLNKTNSFENPWGVSITKKCLNYYLPHHKKESNT